MTSEERATKLEHDIMEAVYVAADESRLVGDVRHELIARAIQDATDEAYERAIRRVQACLTSGEMTHQQQELLSHVVTAIRALKSTDTKTE